ncbi:MAG: endopeptidase La [Muribaculaceae bacterium]|nr:endopeptidase La [Muribaculaceae bacterium]
MQKKTTATSVGHIEIHAKEFDCDFRETPVAVLPTRNLVLFPGVTYPINIVRENSRQVVEEAHTDEQPVVVVCQRDPNRDAPLTADDLESYGVVAKVIKVLPLPDDSMLAIVQGGPKVAIDSVEEMNGKLTARLTEIREKKPRAGRPLAELMEKLRHKVEEATSRAGHPLGQMMLDGDMYQKDPVMSINVVATNMPLDTSEKVELLATDSIRRRGDMLLEMLMLMDQREQLRKAMQEKAKQAMSERQRNAFLETEMEAIRSELYGDADDAARLEKKASEMALSDDVRTRVNREIGKLGRLSPQSPDYQVQLSYLETLLDLPWGVTGDEPAPSLDEAEEILNTEHYGLDKVKERVLEQIALVKFVPGGHAPILCLAGPPGVGKTSLGRSVAKALGRKFERVSLGGLHDESEIRGHRRTYIGAMPGRIIDAVRRAGTSNPVIMLDEIDKVGADYKGDPSAALLEVLDPEQNVSFHDNYIDVDFDLSEVVFITTANTLGSLSRPLLDRMEVVELSGYSAEEKTEIARRHIYPRQLEEFGLNSEQIRFSDAALKAIVTDYTSESGVRGLQKQMAKIMRKCVRALAAGREFDPEVTPERLHDLLGVAPVSRDRFGTDGMAGVVTGLAWTAAGGEVLYIEAVTIPGKGEQLTLTGNLGDVMKESAAMARRWVQANAASLGIDPETLSTHDLHIHVPEGAIPKDGPSAGITMTTAIVSALTGRPVREGVAMTGEMTLRGRVLPVGGIKEKMLAARRAGIKEIYLSADNRRHVEEIDEAYRRDLTFHFVESATEVIAGALQ